MTIKTVTLTSTVAAVNYNPTGDDPYFSSAEKYAWIRNNSDASIFASLNSSCTAYADGTMMIAPAEVGMIVLGSTNTLYIYGTGKAEIRTTTEPVCPFKGASKGGDTYVRILGVTTTPLTDGATTNPIVIDGTEVMAREGDLVRYGSKEFLFNAFGVWDESGDTTNVYTKSEVDALLGTKANSTDVYAKTDTYSKVQSDNLYIPKTSINTTPTTAEINAAIAEIWGA